MIKKSMDSAKSTKFCLTTLCCNDRKTLFAVLTALSIRTLIPEGTSWFLLLQGCTESFLEQIKQLCAKIKINQANRVNFEFLIYKDNMGLSKAANVLAETTKCFQYVMHIEDDWLCLPHKVTQVNWSWLSLCLAFLDSRPDVSTIFLRKYVNAEEKHKFAWTKHAWYKCHVYQDNFNYANKMKLKPKMKFSLATNNGNTSEQTIGSFQEIPTFLFTFNPCIRRNVDYFRVGVFPLGEFQDAVSKRDQWTLTGYDEAPEWGWCESFAMEKIRDLICFNFEAGIFGHYEDWISTLEKSGYEL
jgi:hypothetical protein